MISIRAKRRKTLRKRGAIPKEEQEASVVASTNGDPVGGGSEGTVSDALRVRAILQEGFERQLALYQELTQLAQDLGIAIAERDHQKLIQLVARKQERVEALAQIDAGLADSKNAWALLRETVSEADRADLKRVVEHIEGILRDLLTLEAANESALSLLAQQTQREIQDAQAERRARAAYNLNPPGDVPGALDRRG